MWRGREDLLASLPRASVADGGHQGTALTGNRGGPGPGISYSLPGAKPPARGVGMWYGAHFLSSRDTKFAD